MKDKTIFTIGIVLSLIIAGSSAWLYFKSSQFNGQKMQVGTEVVMENTVPKGTPVVKPDYKNVDIEILNGTGKSGMAKVYADKLKGLGYLKLSTGNYEEIITGNLLYAPTDFGKDINFKNYKYEKSETIKIIIGQ